MLPDVELNFQPSISNCLAWSDDGELAVAAGEFVHVLVNCCLFWCHEPQL